MIADGSGSIENGAVDEVGLWTILHLHNNLFTIVCRTEEIEHDVAVIVRFRNLLCIAEVQIGDPHFSCKKSVEEVYEQIFRYVSPEDVLKAPIGEGVDEFCHGRRVFIC